MMVESMSATSSFLRRALALHHIDVGRYGVGDRAGALAHEHRIAVERNVEGAAPRKPLDVLGRGICGHGRAQGPGQRVGVGRDHVQHIRKFFE